LTPVNDKRTATTSSVLTEGFLEDACEIKGPAAFVYGCKVGCGAKDSMDFRAPSAAGVKIEGEVIHQQQ
jgi:hypothetical protein